MPEFAGFEGLDEIVQSFLITDQERAKSIAYLNQKIQAAGRAKIGGQKVEFDHPYLLLFIDLQPGANWMHPCRYLLIDPATQQVDSVESDRPPLFGMLPSSWRVVWRSPGIQDWQLLPISPPSKQ